MKFTWIKQAINRCKAQTPKVFRKVLYIAGAVSAVMVAIHTDSMEYAIAMPEWWNTSIPYAIGFSTGLVALSLFTQSYDSDGNPIYKDQLV